MDYEHFFLSVMDKGKRPAEGESSTLEEPWRALVNVPVWAEIETLKIWDKKEGESELDYKRRMEMIYKKSQQVYEGIIAEEIAELNERIAQLEREFDRWDRGMDVVDNERCKNAEASGARAEIVEEDVPVVDPNSVLQIDFDKEDPEEDLGEDPEEVPEEGLEENTWGNSEEEAEEFYEDSAEGGYNAYMEVEAADREDNMSESDSDITMWEEILPEPEIVELSDSEEQLDMSDSLPIETPTDSDSTSSDDSGDADFDPDLYEEDRDRMDASPFTI